MTTTHYQMYHLYSSVLRELKMLCHPTCGNTCLWKQKYLTEKLTSTPLVRQTHIMCKRCLLRSISIYGHNVCHQCAQPYDIEEWNYHHSHCKA